MAIKFSTQDISAVIDKRIFFDANVLLYIFWTLGFGNTKHWENCYSSVFGKLIRQKNELLVDFIVISEIVNRTIRLEYDKYLIANNLTRSNLSFKKYRNTIDGQTALKDIYLMINTDILQTFTVVGKAFSKADIQSFLNVDSLDFGDKGILSTCMENSCVLLTNDADYKTSEIDILTYNPIILRD